MRLLWTMEMVFEQTLLAGLPRAVEQDLAVLGPEELLLPRVGGEAAGLENARRVQGQGHGGSRISG